MFIHTYYTLLYTIKTLQTDLSCIYELFVIWNDVKPRLAIQHYEAQNRSLTFSTNAMSIDVPHNNKNICDRSINEMTLNAFMWQSLHCH